MKRRPFEQATLFCSSSLITVVPFVQGAVGSRALQIDRNNAKDIHVVDTPSTASLRNSKKKAIYGVIGLVHSPNGGQSYLAVISRKIRVGDLANKDNTVWRMEAVELIEVKSRLEAVNEETSDIVKTSLISALSIPYFYFSYSSDISQCQQRMFLAKENEPDKRFVWNANLLRPFNDIPEVEDFLVHLIHGFVSINKVQINGKNLTWSLISRRSNKRVGARLFMRGCDEQGNVANFVETEQIVALEDGSISSFVQTRGSMPMFWRQTPNIRYKPAGKMIPGEDSEAGFLAHFKEQLPIYGEQVIVNLVDQKKWEGELEVNLKDLVASARLKDVHYVAFDFHKECKGMRYDKLSILMNQLNKFVDSFDFFFVNPNRQDTTLRRQKGVFRTNCVDCLDRTNVVQSLIAISEPQSADYNLHT